MLFTALQLLLLIKWRSLRGFLWADSHASMESAHKKPRVNCNIRYKVFVNLNGDRLNLEKVFCIIKLQFLLIGIF